MIDRRRALTGVKKGLPNAYQRVEYIANAGKALITMTIPVVYSTDKIICDFKIASFISASSLDGVYGNSNTTPRTQLYLRGSDGAVAASMIHTYTITGYYASLNTKYHTELTKAQLTIDNQAFSISNPQQQSLTDYTTYIFSTRADTRICNGSIYTWKLQRDDKDIIDLVPCYRKSDNVIGMYDLGGSICPQTGTPFYVNTGYGAFEKGPDVN